MTNFQKVLSFSCCLQSRENQGASNIQIQIQHKNKELAICPDPCQTYGNIITFDQSIGV